MLATIHDLLMHFRAKYGFHHRDFHSGNLMMNGLTMKLIDFGEACITCGGKTFSLRRGGAVQTCESADLLIFVSSLYEYSPLEPDVKKKLFGLLEDVKYEFGGEERLDEWYLALKTKDRRFQRTFYDEQKDDIKDETVFHRFYHYKLNDPAEWRNGPEPEKNRSAIAQRLLMNYDRDFLDLLRKTPAAGGRRIRRTRQRKRASRRRTRRRR